MPQGIPSIVIAIRATAQRYLRGLQTYRLLYPLRYVVIAKQSDAGVFEQEYTNLIGSSVGFSFDLLLEDGCDQVVTTLEPPFFLPHRQSLTLPISCTEALDEDRAQRILHPDRSGIIRRRRLVSCSISGVVALTNLNPPR